LLIDSVTCRLDWVLAFNMTVPLSAFPPTLDVELTDMALTAAAATDG
jgi:hypothetical protein